eukprot:9491394-Pyramimonas_sp.AAC.2
MTTPRHPCSARPNVRMRAPVRRSAHPLCPAQPPRGTAPRRRAPQASQVARSGPQLRAGLQRPFGAALGLQRRGRGHGRVLLGAPPPRAPGRPFRRAPHHEAQEAPGGRRSPALPGAPKRSSALFGASRRSPAIPSGLGQKWSAEGCQAPRARATTRATPDRGRRASPPWLPARAGEARCAWRRWLRASGRGEGPAQEWAVGRGSMGGGCGGT